VKTLHAKIGELTLENFFCPARSARRVCCRAQENDRSLSEAERQPPSHRAGDQPGQRLLQAPPGVGLGSEADASDQLPGRLLRSKRRDGTNCTWSSRSRAAGCCKVCWFRKGSRSGGCTLPRSLAWHCCAMHCRAMDEADGDQGPLSPAKHLETGPRAQDLPVSAQKAADHAAQPGLTNAHVNMRCRAAGQWTSPTSPLSADCYAIACRAMDGPGVHLPRCRVGLVHPARSGMAGIDHAPWCLWC
jgi:hypothetical protein